MRSYTVHQKDGEAADGSGFVFVKEGFNWPAFFVLVPWLVWQRQWMFAAAFMLVSFAVGALGQAHPAASALVFLIQLLAAFEANDLHRRALAGRGYRLVGLAAGRDLDEAEQDFFRKYDGPLETGAPVAPAKNRGVWSSAEWRLLRRDRRRPAPLPHNPEVMGLFPKAGG